MRKPAARSEKTAARFLEIEKALDVPRQALARRIAAATGETFRGVEQRLLRIEGEDDRAERELPKSATGAGLIVPRFKLEPLLRAAGIANVEEVATYYLDGGKRPQIVLMSEARKVSAAMPGSATTHAAMQMSEPRAATGTDGKAVNKGLTVATMRALTEIVSRATARYPGDDELALALMTLRAITPQVSESSPPSGRKSVSNINSGGGRILLLQNT